MQVVFSWMFAAALAAAAAPSVPPAPRVDDLSWLTGSWTMVQGRQRIEEHWTSPAGGTLFAVGRVIVGEKTVHYEYLRIESRPDGLHYVAAPKGQTQTDFKLKRLAPGEVEFENPQHDFPQRIYYRRNADGTLTARVEGDAAGKKRPEEFHYQPVKD